ncbi:KTR5 [Candida oxycetoniae]|uniref:KTR5 n=1 Tax=Candida oxycetoniae TaxID=497107 RepID=A0AAI9WZ59_9ASCO|nr:KTR5 [Candida oxycetoniae]KAI3406071.2 KTR5 [Candida oxycetoniae]
MEDQRRNGTTVDAVNKRDKKRSNIAARLNKLELTFRNDRDMFYRNSLHELQNKLASLQQGSNEDYLTQKIRLEETRDYELTKLRLWEEYQVKRVEREYRLDLQKAQENHDKMIKLIKEKLYDKLQKQIKNLKEDKYLLNLLNGNSYSNDEMDHISVKDARLSLHDRRSLRKRAEHIGRFTSGEIDDLSDGGGGILSSSSVAAAAAAAAAGNESGYISSGKRRRLYATRYSSNDEASSTNSARPSNNNSHGQSQNYNAKNNGGVSSGYESNLSDKDYDALNTLIMEDGQSLIHDGLDGNEVSSYKVQTRGSHKQFVGPQGLKPEELNDDLTLLLPSKEKQDKLKYISEKIIDTGIDAPFQYGCIKPPTSASNAENGHHQKANAAFVMLCRNHEIDAVIKSVDSVERHFNQWYDYPWIFLNNEEFTDKFKTTVSDYTKSKVSFGTIESQDWEFPSDLDQDDLYEWIESQGDREILYGNLQSYHKMCRFYSGKFYKHPLIKDLEWYWRVEPDVEFFCDITYDPFVEMAKRGKKYGFNVLLEDLYYSIPGLFRHFQAYIKKEGIVPKSSWKLFTLNSKWTIEENDEGVYDGIHDEREIKMEIQDQIYLQKLIHEMEGKDDSVFAKYPYLTRRILSKSKSLPKLHEDRFDKEDYTLCHFWSNFEIARVDIFASEQYQKLFEYLETTGGFYKERWGDAPIHSLAMGMLLDLNEIHYFRDIGYRHDKFVHCPANAPGHQLEYEGVESELKWLSPDKPKYNGVGCRCKCPAKYKEIEDSGCMKRWVTFTKSEYKEMVPVNVEKWKKRIGRKINNNLSLGGKLEDTVV